MEEGEEERMMRRKRRKKSEREPASVLSETKSWRGELCYSSEELVLRPLAPHHCRRPNCSPTGEKKAWRGPEGEKKKKIIRIHIPTRCITKSNF